MFTSHFFRKIINGHVTENLAAFRARYNFLKKAIYVDKPYPYCWLNFQYILVDFRLFLTGNLLLSLHHDVIFRGGSRNFKTGGAVRARYNSGFWFDAPSHIPYAFVVRDVNNIHIVNILCWIKSKYMRVLHQNLQKQTLFFKPGCAPGAPVLDPPLIFRKHHLFRRFLIFPFIISIVSVPSMYFCLVPNLEFSYYPGIGVSLNSLGICI